MKFSKIYLVILILMINRNTVVWRFFILFFYLHRVSHSLGSLIQHDASKHGSFILISRLFVRILQICEHVLSTTLPWLHFLEKYG